MKVALGMIAATALIAAGLWYAHRWRRPPATPPAPSTHGDMIHQTPAVPYATDPSQAHSLGNGQTGSLFRAGYWSGKTWVPA